MLVLLKVINKVHKPVNDMFNFQYAQFKKITKLGRVWHLVNQVFIDACFDRKVRKKTVLDLLFVLRNGVMSLALYPIDITNNVSIL